MKTIKRAFDLLASVGLSCAALPVGAVVATGIVLTDGRPVFFSQERIGQRGRKFRVWKFRTMTTRVSVERGSITHGTGDPRITPLGNFLRKAKLDELPQLFNVLKGEMSLVGPRPEVEEYTRLYDERQRKVLDVPPGCVDLTHISGHLHDQALLDGADDPEKFYREVIMPRKLDVNLDYVENWSLALDVKILGGTAIGLLSDFGREVTTRLISKSS